MVLHSSNLGTKCSSFAREETEHVREVDGGVSVWILWCFGTRTWRKKRNKKDIKSHLFAALWKKRNKNKGGGGVDEAKNDLP